MVRREWCWEDKRGRHTSFHITRDIVDDGLLLLGLAVLDRDGHILPRQRVHRGINWQGIGAQLKVSIGRVLGGRRAGAGRRGRRARGGGHWDVGRRWVGGREGKEQVGSVCPLPARRRWL